MNKWIRRASAVSLLLFAVSTPVLAESFEGDEGYYVSYDGGKSLVTNFKTNTMDDVLDGMQPGDDVTVTVDVRNDSNDAISYWMKNTVLKNFEEDAKDVTGGAYGYVLTYYGDDGEVIELFNSDQVGGENSYKDREGLREATGALEDYFFLDELPAGKAGQVVLKVTIDGEAEGNVYQDTMAQLGMEFAVEVTSSTPPATTPPTSDPTRIMPYMLISVISGIIIMAVVLFRIRSESEETE